MGKKRPIVKCFKDLKLEKLFWLWPNVIPLSKISLIVGDPDKGKSILSLHMAAQVTTGRPWPNSTITREPGDVLILTNEDHLADTVGPRLKAAGADMNRIHYIDAVIEENDKIRGLHNITKDFNMLVETVKSLHPWLKLIIIDSISGYMEGKNENKNAEVREYLTPLAELATFAKLALVGISHLNKNQMTQTSAYRILGSIAFTAVARAVWLVQQDPENETRRLFVPLKGNLSRDKTGLAYTIMTQQVQTAQGLVGHAYCSFFPETIYTTADELLTPKTEKRSPKKDSASDWLREYLKDGPKLSIEIFNVGSQMGYSQRTLERVKSKLGIQAVQSFDADEEKGKWEWSLLS